MHPHYVASIEPDSQALDYYQSVVIGGDYGTEAQLAAIAALQTLRRGHDQFGRTVNLAEQAVTLAQLRRNADFGWLVASAATLVHPLGIDDGRTPEETESERAWRESHIWLMLFAGGMVGDATRGPGQPRGWQVLLAMLEVMGSMSGERPSPPGVNPPPPVRIFGMLDMGLRR